MAKMTPGDEKINKKEEVRFGDSDVYTASKSLDGESYEGGYPPTMQHHINRGGDGRNKVKGKR